MPAARLLDLSRLVSRAGQGPATGIDRVELAYLQHLLQEPEPLFALVRTTLGFVLLDRAGSAALLGRLTGYEPWGRADLLGRLSQRRAPMRARAEADLRRLCIGRARPAWLARLLRRHLPVGTAYLNVGHSNLSQAAFDAARQLPGGQITVMVHDTIPLDHPELSRPGIPERFAARLRRVGAAADLVLYNSAQSLRDAERHFRAWGRVPEGVVTPLGVDMPRPDPALLPKGLDLSRPYFVTLGTIEPRKNLTFLLDLWGALADDPPPGGVPRLFIVGRRGWADRALFDRLDALPDQGPVQVLGGLPDGAAAAMLHGAAGLLFPSLAEGYGLPPLEAAALGVPVICNDLAVYRETLGNSAVYAPITESYRWRKEIINLLAAYPDGMQGNRSAGVTVPTWADHFGHVLTLT